MPLLIDGEPFIHGLDPDLDAALASSGSTTPTTDLLAHQQNTDAGTNKTYFEIGKGSTFAGSGAIRRGVLFNSGGAGPITAFGWEARNGADQNTGRWVECRNVIDGDVTNPANVWDAFNFAKIDANQAAGQPEIADARAGIIYLLGKLSNPTPPVIGGFNPATGPVGTTVLLNGNNFGTVTGGVVMGAKACTIQGWSNNQISLRIPAGAATDKFTVTTAGGLDVSRDSFTVTAAIVPSAPVAPSNVIATPGGQRVNLTWDAPADAGTAPINDYGVEFQLADVPNAPWVLFRRSVSTTRTASVSGLTNGQPYNFRVSAVNAVGKGAPSGTASATPFSATPSFTATEQTYVTTLADLESVCGSGTKAVAVSASSSDGTSSASQDAANAVALNRAKQLALAGIVCPFVPGTLSLADDSVTNPKLGPDVKVGSLAAARNAYPAAIRATLTSVEAFLVYLAEKVLETPATPVTPVTNTPPVVQFNAPASGSILTAGQSVTLTATATDNLAVEALEFLNGATGVSLGLGNKNGNTYTLPYTPQAAGSLSLVAKATDGAGLVNSATVTVQVQAAPTAPGQVGAVTATAGNTQIGVEFGAIAGATSYAAKYRSGGIGAYITGATGAGSPLVITGLQNGNPYQVVVSALNAVGAGPDSTPVTVTPAAPAAIVYGETLSANKQVADGISFVPGGSETLEIDLLSVSPSGPTLSVVFNSGGFASYADFNSEFGGKPFRFTNRAGAKFTGNLPSSDTSLNF